MTQSKSTKKLLLKAAALSGGSMLAATLGACGSTGAAIATDGGVDGGKDSGICIPSCGIMVNDAGNTDGGTDAQAGGLVPQDGGGH